MTILGLQIEWALVGIVVAFVVAGVAWVVRKVRPAPKPTPVVTYVAVGDRETGQIIWPKPEPGDVPMTESEYRYRRETR